MSTYALGIMVSEERLHAVLVEQIDDESVVRDRFLRTFGDSASEMDFSGGMDDSDGFVEDNDDDYTLEFGDDGGLGEEMFLGSEFGDLDGDGDGGQSFTAPTFEYELTEILKECAEQGFGEPEIALCGTASEMDELELRIPPDEGATGAEDETGLPLPVKRKKLLAMVEEQYEGGADDDRVAFIPMRPTDDGRHRVLALIAPPSGRVLSTLREFKSNTSGDTPTIRHFDGEIPTYLGLARSALDLPLDSTDRTLIVRTGHDDTLALFMEGNTLLQAENLPSLSARDPADTVCSRVLLLQDEYAIGEVQHVFVIGDEGDEALLRGFQDFFPDAEVAALRQSMSTGRDSEAGGYVAATGAALRLLKSPDTLATFQDSNFLPKSYTKTSFSVPVGWSVPALLVVLFLTSLGFVWYYLQNARAIDRQQTQLHRLERKLAHVDQEAIQARIDSMQGVAQKYSQGMDVVNSLLSGSNKWSKGLSGVASQTDSVQGIWFGSWSPMSETVVQVSGHSTARMRIVRFAKRLNGDITSVAFTDIRDWPLYKFTMNVPLDASIPEAAQYWRKERLAAMEGGASPAVSASDPESSDPESSDPESSDPQQAVPTESVAMNEESPPVNEASTSVEETPTAATKSADESSPVDAARSTDPANWTVVIAAPLEEEKAKSKASSFRSALSENDYSIRIRRSPTNGRYLVSVGTFATLDAAKATLENMKDILPDGSWIYEIPVDDESSETS